VRGYKSVCVFVCVTSDKWNQ